MTLTQPTPDARSAAHGPHSTPQQATGSRCQPACRRPTSAQAHCTATECHRTFGSVGGFDRHRRGGTCTNPAEMGMVERDRVWRTPIDSVTAARLWGGAAPTTPTTEGSSTP